MVDVSVFMYANVKRKLADKAVRVRRVSRGRWLFLLDCVALCGGNMLPTWCMGGTEQGKYFLFDYVCMIL